MATSKNISQLPDTTTVNASDFIHTSQGGIDKKIKASDFVGDINEGQPFKPTIKEESTASRTCTQSDVNAYIRCTNTSLTTITVPPSTSVTWREGDLINLVKVTIGDVTVAGGAGVTINPSSSGLVLTEIRQGGTLINVGVDVWDFLTGGNASTSVVGLSTCLTVETMFSGTTVEGGLLDYNDLGAQNSIVKVVYNNLTSKVGSAEYTIKTVAQAATDGDVIDGTGSPNYLGANHALTGGTHVAILKLDGGILNLNCIGCIPFNAAVDNQEAIELAMGFVGVGQTIGLEGDYYAANIDIPNKPLSIKSMSDRRSQFRTIDGSGNPDYFMAPTAWVDSTSSASERMHWVDIGVDGGTKDIAHVVQNFFCLFENYYVNDGVSYGCYQSAKNKDGSFISSTMVNNVYKNIWIQGTSGTGFFIDEDGKSTDWEVTGGFVFNGGGTNIDIRTMAGGSLTDVHCYLSPVSAKFRKWSTGTRVSGNYFENDVEIDQGLDSDRVFNFGPSNTINTDLILNFGAAAGPVKSFGNTLTEVNHNYFGDKKFISNGDVYRNASPFSFTSTSTGNTASIEVIDATIEGNNWSGFLSPSLSMSTKQWLYDETANKAYSEVVTNTDASITATFQDLVNSRAYVVEYGVTSRFSTTSTIQAAHVERFVVQRSAGGGSVTVTTLLSNTDSGSFSSPPVVTTANNLDIIVSATITGSASPVYGRKYLKIIELL